MISARYKVNSNLGFGARQVKKPQQNLLVRRGARSGQIKRP